MNYYERVEIAVSRVLQCVIPWQATVTPKLTDAFKLWNRVNQFAFIWVTGVCWEWWRPKCDHSRKKRLWVKQPRLSVHPHQLKLSRWTRTEFILPRPVVFHDQPRWLGHFIGEGSSPFFSELPSSSAIPPSQLLMDFRSHGGFQASLGSRSGFCRTSS